MRFGTSRRQESRSATGWSITTTEDRIPRLTISRRASSMLGFGLCLWQHNVGSQIPPHVCCRTVQRMGSTSRDRRVAEGRALPRYVEDEFEAYLKCGLLEHGFLRVKCDSCQAEKLVAYSCKRRGFCPSCGARRMVETAALLIDEVLPRQPIRQWVLSLPIALRYLLATRPEVVTQVLGIVYRAISGHLIRKAGLTRASAVTGAVTLIQRFGSALNLNVHFHLLVLDGVYRREGEGRLRFVP